MLDIDFGDKKTFLVTGGAGFIGSNICESLLNLGMTVHCMDNLSTGHIENIKPFLENSNFTFTKADIRDFDSCMDIVNGSSVGGCVDYVLHQAAWGSVPRSIEHPLLYEEINIRGTLNMMEAARQNGVKRFVYASSSSVYGDSTKLPKIEGEEGKTLSPYALTKKTVEEYGRLYKKLYGLNTYGLRYFNVFGKRQDPNGAYAAVIPKFIKQLMYGETPMIYGDGKQSRDFTYVDNVVEGNLKACLASEDAAGEVYNIGAGGREELLSVYFSICNALNIKREPLFGNPRKGDIRDSNASIEKAQKYLNYNPQYNFSAGIKLAIDWYKENL